MAQSYPYLEKPGYLQVVAVLTPISGISNIVYPLIVGLVIVLGTFFVGAICLPIIIPPIVLGIFEISYALDLMKDPVAVKEPNQVIAILEVVAILFGNVLSAIVGIVALVFYNDQSVKEYFANLRRLRGEIVQA